LLLLATGWLPISLTSSNKQIKKDQTEIALIGSLKRLIMMRNFERSAKIKSETVALWKCHL